MKYYKIVENEEIVGFSATEFDKSDCADYIEISKNEYDSAIAEIRAKVEEEEKLSSDEISAEEFMTLVEEAL